MRVQARYHLGVLFDTADYDIACVLLPLSWSRLYAENHREGVSALISPPPDLSPLASHRGSVVCRVVAGMEKQVYYVMLGQQICEDCGAQNDDTYRNLT